MSNEQEILNDEIADLKAQVEGLTSENTMLSNAVRDLEAGIETGSLQPMFDRLVLSNKRKDAIIAELREDSGKDGDRFRDYKSASVLAKLKFEVNDGH